ncbi:uncharacterized protein PAC_08483 [Phialocephala subalpina]|uniref:Monocarboxylate transporter n=1 Tax=Phialocephala subalpina TaxID=576137 RepID=A0A1L7X0P2_9HELO|nr:uncharacterized protein PAC_08483 [Phialocephala subalpina]
MAASTAALIESYDVGPNRAKKNANYELERLSIEDVRRILNCLEPLKRIPGSNNPCGPVFNRHDGIPFYMRAILWTIPSLGTACLLPFQAGAAIALLFRGHFRAIWKEVPRPTFDLIDWARDMMSFVKAPLHLVKKSIEQKAALCVNRRGRFSIRETDYTVMSHVWGETLGWQRKDGWGPVDLSLRKMGLAREHFLRFFDRCDEEWLWVDVIAMPEVLEDMSDNQKDEIGKLRIGIINNLRLIYMKADKVVVIDTLLLRLGTRSPVDVAAVLCLSFWVTRLWTFTETRLAKKVAIKTRDWMFDLDEILEFLARTCINDEHRYYRLFLRLVHLREESVHWFPPNSSLESAYWACENRYTDVDVDQARSLFPLLDLKWEYGWTLQQGLQRILDAYPNDAEGIRKWCQYRSIDFNISSRVSGTLIQV